MEGELSAGGPMLPFGVLLPLTALSLLVLILQLRRVEGAAARFVLAAIWIRYVTALFYVYTFPTIVGSISINALITGGIVVAGVVCIPRPLLLLRWMLPFYLLTSAILLSALLNGTIGSSVNALLKCAYLIVMVLAIYKAVLVNGVQRTMIGIVWVLAPLLLFTAASLALGVVKGSEEDGSASYIGGYAHEAAWSILMLTMFLAASFTRVRTAGVRLAVMAAAIVGIGLANYRTTMLAIAPFALFEFAFVPLLRLVPVQRVLVGCATIIAVLGASLLVVDNLGARFDDFATLINNPPDITDVGSLSYAEFRLFSGRIGIWAEYIDAYNHGGQLQHVFGYGPDAWRGRMLVYAHNSFVSALYETGAFGLASLIVTFAAMIVLACRARAERMRLLVAHVSFLILNLSTLPLWQLEGNIFYAILCGVTFAFALRTNGVPVVSRPMLRAPVAIGRRRSLA